MYGWFPQNIATYGADVDRLFYRIYYVVGAWFVVLQGALLWFIIRDQRGVHPTATHSRGESRGELASLLVAATLLDVLFLAIKGVEYSHQFAAGFDPGARLFWDFCFGLTGVHALHVAAGGRLVGTLAVGVGRGGLGTGASERVGAAEPYWHFVDAVGLTLICVLLLVLAPNLAAMR
jgi:hypothetical protein